VKVIRLPWQEMPFFLTLSRPQGHGNILPHGEEGGVIRSISQGYVAATGGMEGL
jgi:hypothetical protein